jgi:hypothetical protein
MRQAAIGHRSHVFQKALIYRCQTVPMTARNKATSAVRVLVVGTVVQVFLLAGHLPWGYLGRRMSGWATPLDATTYSGEIEHVEYAMRRRPFATCRPSSVPGGPVHRQNAGSPR